MRRKPITITVGTDAVLRAVYDDALEPIVGARMRVRRASNVEPAPGGGWTADMGNEEGPVLGPFKLRRQALAAEVAWINKNVLGL